MPTDHPHPPRVEVLNLPMDNLSKKELLDSLERGVVFTPNIDHLMKLQTNRDFYRAYMRANYRLCDSRIIQLMSSFFFSEKIREQIAGSDFFPAFCDHHLRNEGKVRIFLLGGTSQGVQAAKMKINRGETHSLVVGAYSPPFGFEKKADENEKILHMIRKSGANVLAVGLGAPKQELWIDAHKDQLEAVKLFFAIGKTIDFMGGVSRRAPKWMSRLGLEWLFRLGQEPLRLARRYLIEDMPFFYLALLQKIGRYQNPFNEQGG